MEKTRPDTTCSTRSTVGTPQSSGRTRPIGEGPRCTDGGSPAEVAAWLVRTGDALFPEEEPETIPWEDTLVVEDASVEETIADTFRATMVRAQTIMAD